MRSCPSCSRRWSNSTPSQERTGWTWGPALAGWSEHRGTFKVVGVDKGVFRVDLEYTNTGPVGESNRTAKSQHVEKAIWDLVGKDEVRVCRTEGKDRPDKFETKKGDGRTVEVYKRKKP